VIDEFQSISESMKQQVAGILCEDVLNGFASVVIDFIGSFFCTDSEWHSESNLSVQVKAIAVELVEMYRRMLVLVSPISCAGGAQAGVPKNNVLDE
jgi:hypothetical protein